jgi:hypothetical protein
MSSELNNEALQKQSMLGKLTKQFTIMESSEQNLTYRIIELMKDKGDIEYWWLCEQMNLTGAEQHYLFNVLACHHADRVMPHHIIVVVAIINASDHRLNNYALLPTALFSYNDYLELKASRAAAVEARKYAIWALLVSGISTILTALQLMR